VNFDELLKTMVEKRGTDIYLKVDSPPILRTGEELTPLSNVKLSEDETEKFARIVLGKERWEKFLRANEIDVAYTIKGTGRFRLNIYRQRSTIAMVIRWVRTDISSFEELNLPPILKKIALFRKGLVLVAGPTGCGKSTTQAAMIDYINMHRRCSIVTIEDPIEFLHEDGMSIISQREVGIDTDTFSNAMKYVVRANPDVILIGEMRDPETLTAALSASETGHLVMSTLHTLDVVHSLDRILDFFPPSQHNQIRVHMALNLASMLCQRLISRKDGKGMVTAVEVMIMGPSTRKLIRENEMNKIPLVMQNDEFGEMQTLNQSLVNLVQNGLITEEEALVNSTDPAGLKMNLQGIHLDEERGILREE
jgi:twitching motility protein PilT